MAVNLKITLECSGDAMSALSEAKRICAAGNYETMYVYFPNIDKCISVHKDSNICDVYEIYRLESQLKKSKK